MSTKKDPIIKKEDPLGRDLYFPVAENFPVVAKDPLEEIKRLKAEIKAERDKTKNILLEKKTALKTEREKAKEQGKTEKNGYSRIDAITDVLKTGKEFSLNSLAGEANILYRDHKNGDLKKDNIRESLFVARFIVNALENLELLTVRSGENEKKEKVQFYTLKH